jgi:FKBP-type peptidyl-prolyl cis-trans isomerase SlyD
MLGSAAVSAEEPQPVPAVEKDMNVGLEYTLTVDGVVMDSTEGKPAFHYVHGQGQIVPGLERQLQGLHVGDSREVTVAPEEGYGQVDPAAFVEVPKTQLPADIKPEIGTVLRGVNPDGQSFRARVSDVKTETVVLDLNHPLAGKTLNFKVKIAELAPAPAPTPAPTPQ